MRMMVKKAAQGGKGGPIEIPDDDNHRAAIVAVIGLGTHMVQFKTEPPQAKPLVAIAWEFLDAMKADGSPFVMAKAYTLSLHENATFKAVAETACGKLPEGQEFDFSSLLGKIVKLTITHADNGEREFLDAAGTQPNPEFRRYANLEAVGLADKKDRGQKAKTQNIPFQSWLTEGEPYQPHDWMPWVYHRPAGKRMAIEEIIALSKEKAGHARQVVRQEQQRTDSDRRADDAPF